MPKLIIISGGAGSGKTTLSKRIQELLGERCSIVHEDSYYKNSADSGHNNFRNTDFDNPAAIDEDLLIDHVHKLSRGHVVEAPIYDKRKHVRLEKKETVNPTDFILVEGLFTLFRPEIEEIATLKTYIDVDADIRLGNILRKNVLGFDYDFKSTIDYYFTHTRIGHEEFVEPFKSNVTQGMLYKVRKPEESEYNFILKAIVNIISVL